MKIFKDKITKSIPSSSAKEQDLLFYLNPTHATFSQTHKVGNNGINANFVFPYNGSFLNYLHHMILANMKFKVSWCKKITFFKVADFIGLFSFSFEWHSQKRSWQYYQNQKCLQSY